MTQGFPTPLTQPLGSALGPSYLLGSAVTYDQSIQKTPMSQQWNFGIQKQLFAGWVVDASYTGNRGTHLVAGSYNLDQLNPQYESLGNALSNQVANPYVNLIPGTLGAATISRQQSLLAYPYYTSVTVRNPHLGNSIYHAGLLTVQKRFTRGLTFLASYTKAKLIDDSVASPITFREYRAGPQQHAIRTASTTAAWSVRIDPTDIPQRLAFSLVYKLPFGKGQQFDMHNRFGNLIVGGWQTQSIITLQRGHPILISGANNNLATRPNSTGQSADSIEPQPIRMVQYRHLRQPAPVHVRQRGPDPAGHAQSRLFQLRLLADPQLQDCRRTLQSAIPRRRRSTWIITPT